MPQLPPTCPSLHPTPPHRYVTAFLPRAVYTSGKSSSAAGLTATVVKVRGGACTDEPLRLLCWHAPHCCAQMVLCDCGRSHRICLHPAGEAAT